MMHNGALLFKQMMATKAKHERPNVRTLNTLLRGCLWNAASLSKSSDGSYEIAGGVVTSDSAWKLLCDGDGGIADSSSYEYYITQLCIALRVEEAESRIEEFKKAYKVHFEGGKQGGAEASDPSALESCASSLLAVSRAHAVLGKWRNASESARRAMDVASSAALNDSAHERLSTNVKQGGMSLYY